MFGGIFSGTFIEVLLCSMRSPYALCKQKTPFTNCHVQEAKGRCRKIGEAQIWSEDNHMGPLDSGPSWSGAPKVS